jgi:pilus assembly protein Flp/PilA
MMTKLYCWLASKVKSEEGATMVEYGLMVALIAVVCIAAVTAMGTGINGMFGQIAAAV